MNIDTAAAASVQCFIRPAVTVLSRKLFQRELSVIYMGPCNLIIRNFGDGSRKG